MPDAGDPLVFIFAGCAGFAGLFLLVSVVNGALHNHGGSQPHAGHHAHVGDVLHTDHGGHLLHPAHDGHVPHALHLGAHLQAGHGSHHAPEGPHGHVPHGGHMASDTGASHGAGHSVSQTPHTPHGSHHGHGSHDAHGTHGTHEAHGSHDTHAHHQATNHGHDADHANHASHADHNAHGAPLHSSFDDVGSRLLDACSGLAALAVRSLNLYAILTFLFYFGVVGIVMKVYAHASALPVFSVASGVGVVAAMACTAMLQRLFGDISGVVTRENSRLRGREVNVTRRIRRGGIGEVILMPRGGVTQNIPARSVDGESLSVGQRAVIVEVARGVALVERLEFSTNSDGSDGDEDDSEP